MDNSTNNNSALDTSSQTNISMHITHTHTPVNDYQYLGDSINFKPLTRNRTNKSLFYKLSCFFLLFLLFLSYNHDLLCSDGSEARIDEQYSQSVIQDKIREKVKNLFHNSSMSGKKGKSYQILNGVLEYALGIDVQSYLGDIYGAVREDIYATVRENVVNAADSTGSVATKHDYVNDLLGYIQDAVRSKIGSKIELDDKSLNKILDNSSKKIVLEQICQSYEANDKQAAQYSALIALLKSQIKKLEEQLSTEKQAPDGSMTLKQETSQILEGTSDVVRHTTSSDLECVQDDVALSAEDIKRYMQLYWSDAQPSVAADAVLSELLEEKSKVQECYEWMRSAYSNDLTLDNVIDAYDTAVTCGSIKTKTIDRSAVKSIIMQDIVLRLSELRSQEAKAQELAAPADEQSEEPEALLPLQSQLIIEPAAPAEEPTEESSASEEEPVSKPEPTQQTQQPQSDQNKPAASYINDSASFGGGLFVKFNGTNDDIVGFGVDLGLSNVLKSDSSLDKGDQGNEYSIGSVSLIAKIYPLIHVTEKFAVQVGLCLEKEWLSLNDNNKLTSPFVMYPMVGLMYDINNNISIGMNVSFYNSKNSSNYKSDTDDIYKREGNIKLEAIIKASINLNRSVKFGGYVCGGWNRRVSSIA